jgi:hypothetical protein
VQLLQRLLTVIQAHLPHGHMHTGKRNQPRASSPSHRRATTHLQGPNHGLLPPQVGAGDLMLARESAVGGLVQTARKDTDANSVGCTQTWKLESYTRTLVDMRVRWSLPMMESSSERLSRSA